MVKRRSEDSYLLRAEHPRRVILYNSEHWTGSALANGAYIPTFARAYAVRHNDHEFPGTKRAIPHSIELARLISGLAMACVLIVEDETQVLMLAESVLQQAGHDTLSAATVAEAQAIIINSDEKFDVVFTDVQLANHADGGLTIGTLTGKERPGTPVLYTSARPATDGMQSLFVKPSAFLPKPYTAEQLTEAIAGLLGAQE